MQLKRFRGRAVPEVMRQVREELGPDAVILHTKPSRAPGAFSFLHRAEVEILAAVDRVKPPNPPGTATPSEPAFQVPNPAASPFRAPKPATPSLRIPTPTARSLQAPTPSHDTPIAPAPWAPRTDQGKGDLRQEIRELRDLVIRLGGGRFLPPGTVTVYERLVAAGTDPVLAFEIVGGLGSSVTTAGTGVPATALQANGFRDPDEHIYRALDQRLSTMLAVKPPSPTEGSGVIAVVGPSGTGKTTTLAKLAARATIERGTPWIVSLDGESLGARGQLETLSAILGCPHELALTAEEVTRAVGAGPPGGLTLIDTPGVGPRDQAGLERIRALLRAAKPNEMHLVLSATSKPADALPAVTAFRTLGVTHVLFTHLDETTSHGSLLTVGIEGGLPLSYFATGREIPDDLQPATPSELLRRIVHGDYQQ